MNKWPLLKLVKCFQAQKYKCIDQPQRCISSFICNQLGSLRHSKSYFRPWNLFWLLHLLFLCFVRALFTKLLSLTVSAPFTALPFAGIWNSSFPVLSAVSNTRRVLATLLFYSLSLIVTFISNHIETPNCFLL